MKNLISLLSGAIALLTLVLGCSRSALPEEPSEYAEALLGEFSKGNLGAFWNALPASYQADLTEVKRGYLSTVDADVYDSFMKTIGKIENTIIAQKEFILGFAEREGKREEFEKMWPHVTGILAELLESDFASHSRAIRLDLGRFFAEQGSAILRRVDAIAAFENEDFLAYMEQIRVTTLSRDGDTALVRVEGNNMETEDLEIIRLEGRWMPKEVVDDWATTIAQVNAGRGEAAEAMVEFKPLVIGFLAMFDASLDRIAAARSQDEFDQALVSAIENVMSLPIPGLLLGVRSNMFGESQVDTAKMYVNSSLNAPLEQYRIHMGSYPSTEEGLMALYRAPAGREARWRGPYIREIPVDPWGNEYQYRFPGQSNPRGARGFDIWSKGPPPHDESTRIGNW